MENFAFVSSEMPNQFVSALMLFLSFYQSTLTINQPSLSINPDYQSTLIPFWQAIARRWFTGFLKESFFKPGWGRGFRLKSPTQSSPA